MRQSNAVNAALSLMVNGSQLTIARLREYDYVDLGKRTHTSIKSIKHIITLPLTDDAQAQTAVVLQSYQLCQLRQLQANSQCTQSLSLSRSFSVPFSASAAWQGNQNSVYVCVLAC